MAYFPENDEAYFTWIDNHSHGFVVNCHKKPAAGYLVLHRASCKLIQRGRGSTMTEGDYKKACATDEQELHDWAATLNGVLTRNCSCRP